MEGATGISCAPDAVVSQSSDMLVSRTREFRRSEQSLSSQITADIAIL